MADDASSAAVGVDSMTVPGVPRVEGARFRRVNPATETAMSAIRYEVRFTGRVQGVFFRATTERIARDRPVGGWVRNEADGSVRLVAEGERSELDGFLEEIRAARQSNIEDVAIEERPATGEFEGFRIRR